MSDEDNYVHFDGRPATYSAPHGPSASDRISDSRQSADRLLDRLREFHGPRGRPDVPPALEYALVKRGRRA